MAGDFDPDPELCRQYAHFASHLVRWQFKILYWTMFFVNLALLFLASWIYIKFVPPCTPRESRTDGKRRGQLALERTSPNTRKRANILTRYIFACLGCVFVSTVVVVMEAYALLALQFCDGENLMSLYWSTWTMIQVGSLIAIVGIILALLHSLRNRKHPPWALALGTPVLVIAGFLHLFHDCTKKRVKNIRHRRPQQRTGSADLGPPMSQANTIMDGDGEEDEGIHAHFIGFTVNGGPIVRFVNPISDSIGTGQGEILGYCRENRPIIAYEMGVIDFTPETRAASVDTSPGPGKGRGVAGTA
ncbi:hypothetical protein RJ55_02054 [Drechmeria coniospora]|nr:hypothetical protein RJ55_02054 [Drechmeria coniospora]